MTGSGYPQTKARGNEFRPTGKYNSGTTGRGNEILIH